MKTFSYTKSNNNNKETINSNIEELNSLVWKAWRYRYDTVYGCDGYASRQFNKFTKRWEYSREENAETVDAGKIHGFYADTEVRYNESNDMYFINFKFSAIKVKDEQGSVAKYKFSNSDSMVIGGKFDEFSLLELNKAFIGFENDNNI